MDWMDLFECFGPAVAKLRKRAGLSQEQLAARCGGMSPTFLGEIERREKGFSYRTIVRIAQGLGITSWDLIRFALTGEFGPPATLSAGADRVTYVSEPAQGRRRGVANPKPRSVRILAIVERTPTGYAAHSPDVPGCVVNGRDQQAAEAALHREAAEYFRALFRAGKSIPPATSEAKIMNIDL